MNSASMMADDFDRQEAAALKVAYSVELYSDIAGATIDTTVKASSHEEARDIAAADNPGLHPVMTRKYFVINESEDGFSWVTASRDNGWFPGDTFSPVFSSKFDAVRHGNLCFGAESADLDKPESELLGDHVLMAAIAQNAFEIAFMRWEREEACEYRISPDDVLTSLSRFGLKASEASEYSVARALADFGFYARAESESRYGLSPSRGIRP